MFQFSCMGLVNLLCCTHLKAKQMPFTPSKLRRLVKSKHPYVEHNLDTVVSIIRHSVQNAPAFEAAAQQLKEGPATAATVSDIFNNCHCGMTGQSLLLFFACTFMYL